MDQAYAAVTRTNGAIVAVCKAMIAGRDNFWTSAWEAEPMPYTGWQFEIRPIAGTPGVPVMALYSPDKMIAYVDNEAVWSIDWQSTAIIRSWPRSEDATALIGFCALLMGAKDNFHTNPFPELDYD